MRECVLTLALFLAAAGTHAAEGESGLLRIPLIGGLYSVEAPATWHLEESGADLTATLSETKSSRAALVIAAPNPAVADTAEHNRRAAESLLASFADGKITHEQEEIRSGAHAHALWFEFTAADAPFAGWSRTTEYPDAAVAVQAMTIAPAEEFRTFMRSASPVLDSYVLDAAMAEENADLLKEVGEKIIKGFR
jgi:hypothetical protein